MNDTDIEGLAGRIAGELETRGWCSVDAALPSALAEELAQQCTMHGFKPAGTGRRDDYHQDASVRSDAIRWLDASRAQDAAFLAAMEDLRVAVNRRLFLGLFDYECHYARYAPGAFYGKHVDAFVGAKNRVLSTVLYLNRDWRREEGGELLLYAPDGAAPVATVEPEFNRFVVFLSERFPHEVKPATRERHSIAGWFRVRA